MGRRSLDHPAVDGNDLPADVGGALRGQKTDEIGHFIGPAGPFHGHHASDVVGAEAALAHGRVNDARCHGIDGDACLARIYEVFPLLCPICGPL